MLEPKSAASASQKSPVNGAHALSGECGLGLPGPGHGPVQVVRDREALVDGQGDQRSADGNIHALDENPDQLTSASASSTGAKQ